MAKAGYSVSTVTSGTITLTATTARSVLGVLAPAQFGVDLRGFEISFNGTTTTDAPVLIEICYSTFATNSTPGTANTNETANIAQLYGRTITTGFSAMSAWTSEPTVLTPVKVLMLTPNGGTYDYDWPLGETYDSAVSQGFVIRCTAPTSNVGCRASLRFERT
jgi:hypothetical protein